MIEALRIVQMRVAEALPPAEVAMQVTRRLERIAAMLQLFSVSDERRIAGRILDVPGRGQALVPPIVVTEREPGRMTGTLRINAMYLGSGGAAHGGVMPLIFDEFMGKFANLDWQARSRTACLRVDYRVIVPANVDLRIEVKLDRHEGRKLYLSGTLHQGDKLLADADALFVILKKEGSP